MSLAPFRPTEEQRKVIEHSGSAFICASPGAGKTRVLVERARHLLKSDKTGRGIAFLSFTNAAVSELEGRLREDSLLPSPEFPHFIGTFDSFIWQFLLAPLGIPGCAAPPILIPDQNERLIQPFDGVPSLPLSCFDRGTGTIVAANAKKFGFDAGRNSSQTKAYETAARRTRERFLARGELDYSDVRAIVAAHIVDPQIGPRLSAALAGRFGEVIVDEAQDCNPADLDIISWLRNAGIVTKVICDPHQSIYEFRGGVTEQLFAFANTFDNADRLPMSGNFRSSNHICKAIVGLRELGSRAAIDQALGEHHADPTAIHVLAYPGTSVPALIGTKFHELLQELGIAVSKCPVVAATWASCTKAVGQPGEPQKRDLTVRLASAITGFDFSFELGNRQAALQEVHKVVLEIEGGMGGKTYKQYLAVQGIQADDWRPDVLALVRALHYDPAVYPTADAWHERAKELLAPRLPPGSPSIAQRLRRNTDLVNVLAAAPPSSPPARTIHSVKGMEFPAVCVVMTTRTAKGILDYLENGSAPDNAESAREIYVGASRAQRLVAFAVPKNQANRLAAHIRSTGAAVEVVIL